MNFNENLKKLNLQLPEVPKALANYINSVKTGNLLFLSGGIPIRGETKIVGKVPTETSIQKAREASEIIILNRLAVIKEKIGDLNLIQQIVTLNGFVNSTPEFTDHPLVIDSASELLLKIFDKQGKHSRTAVGVNSLPLNVSVEINLVIEVKNQNYSTHSP